MEAPELSKARSKMNESPMYIATLKNYKEIFEQLIFISDSADCGQHGNNALHAAVRNGNEGNKNIKFILSLLFCSCQSLNSLYSLHSKLIAVLDVLWSFRHASY